MNEQTREDVLQQAERDDAIYQQWTEQTEHDPRQPLTDQEWQDFCQTWSKETEQPLDPEQLNANPFQEDMRVQELDLDIPDLSELVEERNLEPDQAYVQELDTQGLIPDNFQPDVDPTLIEPSREAPFQEHDGDFGR